MVQNIPTPTQNSSAENSSVKNSPVPIFSQSLFPTPQAQEFTAAGHQAYLRPSTGLTTNPRPVRGFLPLPLPGVKHLHPSRADYSRGDLPGVVEVHHQHMGRVAVGTEIAQEDALHWCRGVELCCRYGRVHGEASVGRQSQRPQGNGGACEDKIGYRYSVRRYFLQFASVDGGFCGVTVDRQEDRAERGVCQA